MNANPFPPSKTRASKPLELIHTDLHGPFKIHTISGYRYWITFIDDYTQLRAVIFLKSKDEAFDAFKQYKAYSENHLYTKIQCMRVDKGGEYMSTNSSTLCLIMELLINTLSELIPNKTVWLNERIEQLRSMSLPCLKNLVFHPHF